MTFEMSFLIIGLVEIFSHFVLGCTGFGATVIAAPVVNGLLGTQAGVPYGTLITTPMLYIIAIKGIKNIAWKDFFKIILFCAPGMALGNFLFYRLDANVAKICIGGMVLFIAVMNLYKCMVKPMIQKKKGQVAAAEEDGDTMRKKLLRYGCLLLGGAVHGAFTIGGPLITVYTIEAVKEKEKFRDTMGMVWVILNTINVITQVKNGVYTPYVWSALAIGFPMALIGFFAGMWFLKRIKRESFLKMIYLVLLVVGGDMFFRSLAVFL